MALEPVAHSLAVGHGLGLDREHGVHLVRLLEPLAQDLLDHLGRIGRRPRAARRQAREVDLRVEQRLDPVEVLLRQGLCEACAQGRHGSHSSSHAIHTLDRCQPSSSARSSSASATSPRWTTSTSTCPRGICLGLLGPNGAGKSTTMRLLTGQAIADEGDLRVLGHELPGESKEARAKMGVVPQLDNLDVDVTVEDNLAVFARLYRVKDVRAAVDRCAGPGPADGPPQGRRGQALRRHAPPPAARARARALPQAAAAGRAHRGPRPPDPHRAVDADRRPARRGGHDPHVHALHRGGAAPGRRGGGDGARAR